jgi:hypothetical protein
MFLRSQSRRGLQSPNSPARARRGALLADVGMATIVLMVAMSLMLKIMGTVALERRVADHRQRAALEVANLMERITAQPFDLVTTELARKLKISEPAKESLRDFELAVDVKDEKRDAPPELPGKRISITLRWRESSGQWQAPVRLTSWITRTRTGS